MFIDQFEEELLDFQPKIQEDPILFYDNVLGCTHWSKQDEITRSVFKNQKTTVRSCHGIGKSFIAARVGMAFLYAFKDSIVVTTAPTFRQVQNVIWREWRGAYAKAKIPLGKAPLKVSHDISENWYALGFSAKKADNFQGLHSASGHMLVIVDEAAGADPETMIAIDALLTSQHVHVLYIGNPTSPVGEFYDSHKSPYFIKYKISVFDTPNFKYNKIRTLADLKQFKTVEELTSLHLPYPQLVTPMWAWDKVQKWGETNPLFLSRVLAEFPEEGSDILIPLHLVDKALNKEFDEEEWVRRPVANVIGIDVARFGEDNTVLTAMDNYKVVDVDWYNGKDTMGTVGAAQALMKKMGWTKQYTTFVVDDTGVGGGVSDRLSELGFNVIRVNFGEKSSDQEMYANLKAEIFWHIRQLFLDEKIQLIEKGNSIAEIPTIRYNYRSSGQLEIISKAQMKKDGLKSPDFADSLALACWGIRGGSDQSNDYSAGRGKTIAGNLFSKKF